MRKLGRITRSKSYKIHVSLCEGCLVSTPYSRHYYLHKLRERLLWKYKYALFAFGYLFSQCISTFALTLIEMERQGNAQTSPVFVEDLENLVSSEQGDGDIM